MFTIIRYTPDRKDEWDSYVRKARNGYFLFLRNYMDYHSDRFTDHSLMFYIDGKLHSILPANIEGDTLRSHHGLTFGGLLMDINVTVYNTVQLFRELNEYLRKEGIKHVVYSPVPWVYHQHASEEDLYPLFWECHANVIKRDIGTVIFIQQHLKWRKGRLSSLKKALHEGVTVERTTDFAPFWKVLEDNLRERHGVKPVHTIAEIELLHSRFPENIVQYNAMYKNECIAGMTFYIYGNVIHAQYSASNETGKKLSATDTILDRVLHYDYADMQYFDFGRSTEGDGSVLNHGLISQKEGFGGRGVVYDTYQWDL